MPPNATKAELLRSLGQLVRGLSTLFWGLPIALVVCVQTAKGDWFRDFGMVPALVTTGWLWYGLYLLGSFQKQERVWRAALDRASVLAILNFGLSPFLYWSSRISGNRFYDAIVVLMVFGGLSFLFALNPVLNRLAAMLPDETMRGETRLFTALNRYFLVAIAVLVADFYVLRHIRVLPSFLITVDALLRASGLWPALFLVLLPMAMTMALAWKIKEVILASVFSPGEH
jgi:hypothetical protein